MMTTPPQENSPSAKSRKPLIAILLVSILPIASAYFVFFTGVGMPDTTVNAGKLLSPASHVTEILADGNEAVLQEISDVKKWRIFLPIPESCSENCEKNLYTTRQVYIRLGEKSARVERYAINLAGDEGEQYLENIRKEHPLLKYASVNRTRWNDWMEATDLNLHLEQTPYYLLVDQEGFAMMAYTADVHGNDLLKDLKRALKYSIDYQ